MSIFLLFLMLTSLYYVALLLHMESIFHVGGYFHDYDVKRFIF